MNADGKPDVIVKELEAPYVRYFLLKNTSTLGNISFEFVRTFGNSPTGKLDAAIGDVDGDGLPEIIVQDNNEVVQGIAIWRNLSVNNDFSFETPGVPATFSLGGNANLLALADFNGDGKLDIVAVQADGTSTRILSLLQNTATPGTISPASFAARVTFTPNNNCFDMTLGDVDGDGKTDILLTGGAVNGRVFIFRNSGSATIGPGFLESQVDLSAGHTPRSVALGDLNGDGKPDIT
ncbi:MAG: FG-GAP repeat domain-containing protein, partial [Bacteroidia bacterium]